MARRQTNETDQRMPDNKIPNVHENKANSPTKAVRTAIILAAGMGVRLEARGKLRPKGCICLGERSIVEESVRRLIGVGIERIVVVTGHLAEQYESLRDQYSETIQLVHNPYFADSGSLYSMCCARDSVDEDFLLLESDIVFEHRALTTCLEHPSENVVLLSGFSHSSDECFVETEDDCLVAISKNRESLGTDVPGELVGICKISRSLFAQMFNDAKQRFKMTRHLDYETDGLVSATENVRISCPVVEDLVWCEIDDETHFAHAQNEIYPIVQRNDAKLDTLLQVTPFDSDQGKSLPLA